MKKLKLRKLKYKGLIWYLLSTLGWISFFNLLIYITNNKDTFDVYDWFTSIILSTVIGVLSIVFAIKDEKIISQYYRILAGEEE